MYSLINVRCGAVERDRLLISDILLFERIRHWRLGITSFGSAPVTLFSDNPRTCILFNVKRGLIEVIIFY